MILAGRRLNDNMGSYVVSQIVKLMLKKRIHISGSNVLVMGLTFKENCPDLRNTRVIDIINEFRDYGANVDVYDPWVDKDEAVHEYNIRPIEEPGKGHYDAVILAVKHDEFVAMGLDHMRSLGKPDHVLYDIKYIFPAQDVDGRL